jgi:uncharacterized protein
VSEFSVRSPLAPASIAAGLAVVLALAWSAMSGDILRPLLDFESIRGIPYLRSGLTTLGDIAVMLALTSLAARKSPGAMLALAGLGGNLPRSVLWAILVFGPPLGLCLALARPGAFDSSDILWPAVGSPFLEEVLYRGLAIGILMRLCGWPFLAAALLPAAFFGLAHMAQGEELVGIAGVVAITGLGGLLFGWLFVRWNFNLWPPVLLHMGMNALWIVFDLGENAIGGWFGNAQRLLIVALAIGLSLLLAPKRR